MPVEGRVLYKGEPVPYGGVMFQPESGQPARGQIQPDGTFKLSTFGEADGATVGRNLVRITSLESQRPAAAESFATTEAAVGKSGIPLKYSNYSTSDLEVEVKREGNEPFVFELKD